MREGIEIFISVCQMPDMERAIADLSDAELRQLIGYAGGQATDNNVAGVVLGHALVTAADRFMKQGGNEG